MDFPDFPISPLAIREKPLDSMFGTFELTAAFKIEYDFSPLTEESARR